MGPAPGRGGRQLDLFPDRAADSGDARAVGPAQPKAQHVALARRLPRGVRLGTSSWSFPGWAGIVYDARHGATALARDGLAAYARHPLLRAVGIDRTFYAPLAERDFAGYAEVVPVDFRFLVKAQEVCTLPAFPRHARYGARAGEANPRFLDPDWARDRVVAPAVAGLGPKLGAILFQFTPLGRETTRDPARFAARLAGFLTALPRGPVYAVELRNAGLLVRDYAQALADAAVVHCANAHPTMPGPSRQLALLAQAAPGSQAAGPCLVRWMLPQGLRYEQARERYRPFDRLVEEDPPVRHEIVSIVRDAVAAGREALVVINNKAEGSAPLSAFCLAEAIAGADAIPAP